MSFFHEFNHILNEAMKNVTCNYSYIGINSPQDGCFPSEISVESYSYKVTCISSFFLGDRREILTKVIYKIHNSSLGLAWHTKHALVHCCTFL